VLLPAGLALILTFLVSPGAIRALATTRTFEPVTVLDDAGDRVCARTNAERWCPDDIRSTTKKLRSGKGAWWLSITVRTWDVVQSQDEYWDIVRLDARGGPGRDATLWIGTDWSYVGEDYAPQPMCSVDLVGSHRNVHTTATRDRHRVTCVFRRRELRPTKRIRWIATTMVIDDVGDRAPDTTWYR
jgi:hypothetical protein